MPKACIYLSLLILSIIDIRVSIAQSFNPYYRQFTVEDGLPSSEVHFVLQDREGYMWFGTDNGVARFDGSSFEVFNSDHGLEDVVVFKIREDKNGRIWVSTYSSKIYYFFDGRFYPYKFNDRLLTLKDQGHIILLEDINDDLSFLFKLIKSNFGFLTLDSLGNMKTIDTQGGIYFYEWKSEKQSKGSFNYSLQDIFYHKDPNRDFFIYDHDNKKWKFIAEVEVSSSIKAVIRNDANFNDFLFLAVDSIIHINNDEEVKRWSYNSRKLNHIFPHHDKGYIICKDDSQGIHYLRYDFDTEKIQVDSLFQEYSFSHGIYDADGGLWLTSLDAGVLYIPHPHVTTYDPFQYKPSPKPQSIALVDGNYFFAGYTDGAIRFFDVINWNFVELINASQFNHNIFSLFYDSSRKILLTPSYIIDFDPTVFKADPKSIYRSYFVKEKFLLEAWFIRNFHGVNNVDSTELLFTSFHILGKFNLKEKDITWKHSSFTAPGQVKKVFKSYFIDDLGRHWVGTLNGLYQYFPKRDTIVSNDLGIPALRDRVDRIISLDNGALLFGTRGHGIVYYDRDTSFLINHKLGLASDLVRDMHITEDGSVWVATFSGISKLVFDLSAKTYQIRSFGPAHGLVSKEVYDIDSYENQVWLVTGNGIIRFNEPPINETSIKPTFRHLKINGSSVLLQDNIVLKPDEDNLEIKFNTLNYKMIGDIEYRYRIQNDQIWQRTKQGQVNFSNLNPGNYLFEVQSKNEDDFWSESASLGLKIKPYWYQRRSAQIGGILFMISIISGFIFQRERRKRKEESYTQQIERLERAALHAQMNPHFVFNCLNSIQNFILSNDTTQATYYLAQFAQLIRDTLRLSVKGQHSLEDEVRILENYLSLEKLRFKEGFDYKIEIDNELARTDIFFPSLLIQPFVENAIKHGLKDRDSGGRVEIVFTREGEELQVRIRDNGMGFEASKDKESDSMSMDITKRRLELMDRQSQIIPRMKIKTLRNEDNQLSGTEIILLIKISSKNAIA